MRYAVKAGFEALTTYELAKRVAKRPENAGLRPHVADMRRALRRMRTPKKVEKAKATKQATKTPPPATPQPTKTA